MRLDVYVNYRGTCEQAFRFYEQQLGGRITGVVRHGEMPNPRIAADWFGASWMLLHQPDSMDA